METRTLGQQGLTVSALGYGAMGTAAFYGATDDTESIAAIRRAHDGGVTFFDTAELYGWGVGEELLGHALAPIRDEVVIATKFGFTRTYGSDSRPEHIREVVDNSLRNLGVDVIDVLYQHVPDPNVPIEDVVGVMKEYVDAGKVKYLGLSNADEDTVRRAHAVHPISMVQEEYSIFARESEVLLPVLEELGIGLVAYSPLARGFLSGAVQPRDQYDADDVRQMIGWWAPENFDANVEIASRLRELAASKGVTLSQLALAWLLARKDYVVPIPGSRNPERVAQNVAAAGITLTDGDLARIAEIAPGGAVGERGV
ncbi:aldo/keto reductase [Promicromonospora iranensis]|uniref:Aryl-alcohol dehydrogenase-like predicted oxidoreductase n=1 Tax=Promicromonospora iranensis TaxID=1105144 RepID=A0ABU2CHY4_9MICO|nr:aldo/keto reductase [Promicromonospora iranensis]MDR7380943.1 aryl-alcohol dehydrogenase-like predicted oxidoreductase [Promicromonospora iranensis]